MSVLPTSATLAGSHAAPDGGMAGGATEHGQGADGCRSARARGARVARAPCSAEVQGGVRRVGDPTRP